MIKKASVVYPFLFAVFPVLFLYAYNIDEVPVTDILLPIFIFLICTLVVFFALRLIVKDYKKGAIITTYFLVLFFIYGYTRELASGFMLCGSSLSNTYILMSVWVVIFVTGALLIWRTDRIILPATKFLNVVAVTLIVFSVVNIGIHEIGSGNYADVETGANLPSLTRPDESPDIYYIILDGYARYDTLDSIYNYDNSEFLDYLTGKGFYVASESRSNYSGTTLSLASSLNMEYINYLSDTMGLESGDRTGVNQMFADNKVKQLLESQGYRFIYVVSSARELGGMDSYNSTHFSVPLIGVKLSSFSNYLVQTTALAPLYSGFLRENARNTVLGAFDFLSKMPEVKVKAPLFVFAHILAPHPPYIFDRDGNTVKQDILEEQGDVWKNKDGYIEQLIFINGKVQELVDSILSKSDIDPVIILQADHGTAATTSLAEFEGEYSELSRSQLDERMNILNAYLLPQDGSSLLYDSITPVNTFRVVLNYYFGAGFEMLEDESYFSSYGTPYKFFRVP